MLLIPAIDLKAGQCVRLKRGLMTEATVFSDKPDEMAAHWVQQGARRLHLVDLDGAFAGKPENLAAIRDILTAVNAQIPVQLGGGIRDLATIEAYLDMGLSSVIIGTAAMKDPSLVKAACTQFPGHIMVGIDAKDGLVAIDGWAVVTDQTAIQLALTLKDLGVSHIIYTDIGRDGMMTGLNIEATAKLAKSVAIPVIASGGFSNLQDIEALVKVEQDGVIGAITGRAIYAGSLDFAAAQQLADRLSAGSSSN